MRHFPQTRTGTGWSPQDHLAPEAATLANRRRQTLPDLSTFKRLGCSYLPRAYESLQLLFPNRVEPTNRLQDLGPQDTGEQGAWKGLALVQEGTMEEYMQHVGRDLLEYEGRMVLNRVIRTSGELYLGERALLISHSPLIESAIAVATGVWPPVHNFKHGDVAVFTIGLDMSMNVEYLPLSAT